ncbi:MAG: cytochrome c oxidase subunit 2A [Pedobacter sp.]|nr:MAG: cytochrome c oxidase subunit 2A [Pedobacter sp.]
MEITEKVEPQLVNTTSSQDFDKNFKPKGAIAFFLLLITLGLIIWFGIYFLMLDRL